MVSRTTIEAAVLFLNMPAMLYYVFYNCLPLAMSMGMAMPMGISMATVIQCKNK